MRTLPVNKNLHFFSKKVSPASKTRFNSRDHGPEPRQRAPGRAIRKKSLRLFLNASASCRKALGSPRSLPEESFQLLLQSCSSRPHSVPLFQKAWRRPIPGRRGPCLLLFVLLRVQFQPKRSGSCLIVSAVQTQGAFGTDHYGCRRLGASLFAEAATVAAVGLHHGHGHRHALLCNDVHGSIGAAPCRPCSAAFRQRPGRASCSQRLCPSWPSAFPAGAAFSGRLWDRPSRTARSPAGRRQGAGQAQGNGSPLSLPERAGAAGPCQDRPACRRRSAGTDAENPLRAGRQAAAQGTWWQERARTVREAGPAGPRLLRPQPRRTAFCGKDCCRTRRPLPSSPIASLRSSLRSSLRTLCRQLPCQSARLPGGRRPRTAGKRGSGPDPPQPAPGPWDRSRHSARTAYRLETADAAPGSGGPEVPAGRRPDTDTCTRSAAARIPAQ